MLEGATLFEGLIGVTESPLLFDGSNVLAGLEVRVSDSSLEPLLPEGSWVLVASTAATPLRGAAVLIEVPTGKKVIGYFILSDVEHGILLMRTKPPLLEPRLWWSPRGSRIVGAVIAFAASSKT